MEAKTSKTLDGTAHLSGVSTSTNVAVKQMRLVEGVSKPYDSGPGISSFLARIYLNNRKSGIPIRLMFYKNNNWLDYPENIVDLVKEKFKINKANVEVELDGQEVLLDFLHMYHLDLKTGFQQPIAWIDEEGNCFFPEVFGGAIRPELDADLDAYTESIDGKLDEDSVREMFLTGMTALGITESDIVDIYRNSGMSMQTRLELFQKQVDLTKGIRGEANVRYAWLACSKEELSKMSEYGLRRYGLSPFNDIYGLGVHLATVARPYACSLYCDVDENEIKHLVLCRVIMGKMELLRPGSDQHCSSGYEYDNGVDDIQRPEHYVVWNMNRNTHIYPEFVVSFKAPLDFKGNVCSNESKKDGSEHSTMDTANVTIIPANTGRSPRSPWIPFLMLFASIKKMVPSRIMFLIYTHYTLLKSKKISHDDFKRKLRLIIGDNMLKYAIYNNIYFKTQPRGGSNSSNI